MGWVNVSEINSSERLKIENDVDSLLKPVSYTHLTLPTKA